MTSPRILTLALALASVFAGLAFSPLLAQTAPPAAPPPSLAEAQQQLKTLARANDTTALAEWVGQIINRPDATTDLKLQAGKTLAEAWRRQQRYDHQRDLLLQLEKLPVAPEQRADLRRDLAAAYHRLRQPAEAEALERADMEDDGLPPASRAKAFKAFANRLNANLRNDRTPIITEGRKLMAAGFPANVHQDIRKTLADSARISALSPETLEQIALEILAEKTATTSQKLAANWDRVWVRLLQQKNDEAEKMVRWPLQNLDPQGEDLWTALEMVGKCAAAQGDCDRAIKHYRDLARQDKSPAAQKRAQDLIYQELLYFKRFEDAADLKLKAGDLLAAAQAFREGEDFPKAKAIAAKLLADPSQPHAARRTAFLFFLDRDDLDRQIRAQYGDDFAAGGDFDFPALKGRVSSRAGVVKSMYLGDYQNAVELADLARRHQTGKNDVDVIIIRIHAAGAMGRHDEAAALAAEYATYQPYPPAQRYRLALLAAMFRAPDQENAFQNAVKQAEQQFTDLAAIDSQTRSDTMVSIGRAALLAKKFTLTADIEQAWNSLFEPAPRKTMTVNFSETTIHGITDWEKLSPKPEVQFLDRKFGGKLDFLVTDVSTGDRGAGIGEGDDDTQNRRPTEFSAVADRHGVHFLFTGHDPRAAEVEARLLSGGSYELYLAPGFNQPYFCVIGRLNTGQFEPWNTTYDNESHRRLTPERGFTSEHRFTPTGYTTYIFFDWSIFYDKLPDQGDIWEFENVHWSRNGGIGWNGTRTIHGRSTWGHLVFAISPTQQTQIKRRLLFLAREAYLAEKTTLRTKHGVIDLWQDPQLGDQKFYQQDVEPLIKRLDGFLTLANTGMTDADVTKVFAEAVPAWAEIRFKIAELRRQYLEKKLLATP